MPFMVIYGTSDGSSRYEQTDAIDEAALFVERLRNSESIDQIRIFRMEEISFAFRPYYKVELGMPERQTPPPEAAEGVTAAVEPPSAPEPETDGTPPVAEAPPTGIQAPGLRPLPPPPGLDAGAAAARRGLFGR